MPRRHRVPGPPLHATSNCPRTGWKRNGGGARVWLNPPFGRAAAKWLRKLADHGNGIALIPARTETAMFTESVWQRADAVLFLHGRPHFHRPDGSRAAFNSGAPICLVAYGIANVVALSRSRLGTVAPILRSAA